MARRNKIRILHVFPKMIENIVLSCHLSETNYGASASPDAYAIVTYIIPNRFQDNLQIVGSQHLVVSLYI